MQGIYLSGFSEPQLMNPQSEDEYEEFPRCIVAASYLPFHGFSPLPEIIKHYKEKDLCSVVSSACGQFTGKKICVLGEETEKLDERLGGRQPKCWQITRARALCKISNWKFYLYCIKGGR
jgi:hypothetical protein